MKTVQDWVLDIRKEAMSDITPDRAATLLHTLSALLGSVNEMWIEAEMNYNKEYQRLTVKYEKISQARANAKASQEYEDKLKMEALVSVVQELINSMKYVIKNKLQEQREVSY